MATQITTQVIINASIDKVWNTFTDFQNYPNWNPFIKSLTGNVKAGEQIKVILQQPGKKPMEFNPRVLVFEKKKEFKWIGHLFFPGIFDGEHDFKLQDNGNGTTTFIQSEKFKGVLVPFLKKMLENDTVKGFTEMNERLKAISEQG